MVKDMDMDMGMALKERKNNFFTHSHFLIEKGYIKIIIVACIGFSCLN